eukprot:388261-Rhodomonas_salina.1
MVGGQGWHNARQCDNVLSLLSCCCAPSAANTALHRKRGSRRTEGSVLQEPLAKRQLACLRTACSASSCPFTLLPPPAFHAFLLSPLTRAHPLSPHALVRAARLRALAGG